MAAGRPACCLLGAGLLPGPGLYRAFKPPLNNGQLADVAPGRSSRGCLVAFASGIALYFTAEREPSVWAAGSLAAVTIFSAHPSPTTAQSPSRSRLPRPRWPPALRSRRCAAR